MLFLEISGHKARRRRCESAVSWFVGKYFPKHKLDIRVHHRGLLREGVYGWISVEDCDYRPRAFLVELHNMLNLELYTKTLFHELQHMHQHIRGDLRDKGPKRLWRGIDCTEMDYDDLPWEIEAHLVEEPLYFMYLTETGQSL